MAELITGYGVEQAQKQLRVEEALRQFLTFAVNQRNYAIDILQVSEIIEVSELTDVPMMPTYIRGVINLRGQVVPVIDLGARLKQGAIQLDKRSCIVLVRIERVDGEQQMLGMLVDAVSEIIELAAVDIKAPPRMGSDIDTRFIEAMGRIEDHWIILLATQAILSGDQLSELEQFSQTGESELEFNQDQ